ncbi:MAG: hypothetical protein JWM56_89 [Candidatus Peribacteria bacterium]|nr:hypothetical protein [Candidatus Peribacteria bacterium]
MYKGGDIIGKSIMARATGREIDSVKDVLFDAQAGTVLGFLVREPGMLHAGSMIPFANILSIGIDAVIVESEESLVVPEEKSKEDVAVKSGIVAKGTRVMTEDGRDLGQIADLYFDDKTGRIEGYEVSGGLFSDAYSGRSFLPAPPSFRIGEDVAFVPDDMAKQMEEQVGGIQKIARDTGDTLTDLQKKTTDTVQRAAQAAQEKAGSVASDAKQNVTEDVADKAIEQAVGRRATLGIYSDKGSLVVAPGQIVTKDIVERVRLMGKEQELMEAVQLNPAKATKEATQQKAQEGLQNMKKSAQSAWEKVKESAMNMREKTARQMEDMRIQRVLGLPVTRVILDDHDRVLLQKGDLITHEAIDRAREAKVLDILLNSADTSKEKNRVTMPANDSQPTYRT